MTQDKSSYNSKQRVILAFFIGAIVSVCFSMYGIQIIAKNVGLIIATFVVFTILLSLGVIAFIYHKEKIFRSLFGVNSGSIKEVKNSLIDIVESVGNRDLNNAKDSVEKSFNQLAAWIGWLNFRRWVVITFSTLLLGFATLLGSALLFNQNELLETQNRVIDIQTQLIETQNDRITQQTYLMDSEMKKPNRAEVNAVEKLIESNVSANGELPYDVIVKVYNTLFSFKPYRYLDDRNDELNSKPYSPEKSRVFLKLLSMNVDDNTLNTIKNLVEFNFLHISNTNFPDNTNLSGFTMNGCNFYSSTFRKGIFDRAKLNATIFKDAWMEGSSFKLTFIPNADFSDSQLYNVDFSKAALNGSTFKNADLFHTVLDSAVVSDCDFRGAVIYEISAKGTDFSSAIAYQEDRFSFVDSGLTEEQLNQIIWEIKPE